MIRGYYSHFDCRVGNVIPWRVEFDSDEAPASKCPKCGKAVPPDRTKPLAYSKDDFNYLKF